MKKQLEIAVPDMKVLVTNGKLHPSARVWISCEIHGSMLIKPIVVLKMPGHDEDFYLNLSTFGADSLLCKLDFVNDVFAAFDSEDDLLPNESLTTILTVEALSQCISLIRFDLRWQNRGGECLAFGDCRLALRKFGEVSYCTIISGDKEESMELATFFSELPTLAAPTSFTERQKVME